MEDRSDFTTTLRGFMARARRSNSDLAQLTSISISTIEKWTSGIVRRPRFVADVLTLAHALGLDAADTTALLRAAGHPPLATLDTQAKQTDDRALAALLATWPLTPASDPARAATSAAAPPHAPCHQLRAPVADFVGRAQEIDQLVSALRRALAAERGAIISGVQGMGGIGKTELAYAIAHQLRDTFPDAQLMLNLRGSSATPLTPQQTLQAVIHTLIPEARLPDDLPALEQHYRTLLHNQRVLILADDAAGVVQVQALIPPVGSALLLTSRTRFLLPGMTMIDLEQLAEAEAIALLRHVCPRLTADQAQALARACGSLPLALRVSGGILRTIPALDVADYLALLHDTRQRLSYLRDPDDPHLDVEASLMLSYTQLDAATQAVFRQLGVFAADFATPLVLSVVVAAEGVNVVEVLHRLLRRNLVLYNGEQGRWRLHDLVRDLARNALERDGEREATMWRYARAMVALAEQLEHQYLAGSEPALLALSQFDAERAHFDAAFRWAQLQAETPAGDQLLLDIARASRQIGYLRSDPQRESLPKWERVRMAARRLGDLREEARALGYLGMAYFELGQIHKAITYFEQALAIHCKAGNRQGEGHILAHLGHAHYGLGELSKGISYYEQHLAIACELGNRHQESLALANLATSYCELGEVPKAISYNKQALAITREFGDRYSEGCILCNLGKTYTELGDTGRAIEFYEAARSIVCAIENRRLEAYVLGNLARTEALQGDMAQASNTYRQAGALFQETGDRWGEAQCNWLFGLALAQQGEQEEALPLLRAAVAYEQEIGHAEAAEHAALLERLEAGEDLPAALRMPTSQRAVGDGTEHSTNDNELP